MEAESSPYTVIAEWSAAEMEWYRAQYVKPADIAQAFGLGDGALSRPAATAVPGAPSSVQPPRKRPQLWVSLFLGIVCLVIGVVMEPAHGVLANDSVPLLELLPAEVRLAADEVVEVEARAKALRRPVQQAVVDAAQAHTLEATAKAKTKLSDKHAARYRERADLGWSTADRIVREAMKAVGLPAPESFPNGADGRQVFPIAAIQAELTKVEARASELVATLPEVPEKLPDTWPTRHLRVEARETLTRDEAGTGEVLAEFSDTLLSSQFSGSAHESMPFEFRAPGSYWVHVRGAVGRRGAKRLAPPGNPKALLSLQVREGTRTGVGTVGGAMFFFMWFVMEIFLRMARFVFYVFRLSATAIGEVFS
jgi:hypothetical protein